MATGKRKGFRDGVYELPKQGYERRKYFYLNGKLHKVILANRPGDLLTAWCYPDRCRATYILSDVKKHMQTAFDLNEVCVLLNKSRVHIERVILAGAIPKPQKIYRLDGRFNETKYKFSEDDVLALHSYFLTCHFGRPRKDGLIRPAPMPSRRELKALMRHREMLYVRDKEGNIVPVFQQEGW